MYSVFYYETEIMLMVYKDCMLMTFNDCMLMIAINVTSTNLVCHLSFSIAVSEKYT